MMLKFLKSNMDISVVLNPYAIISYIVAYITKNEESERELLEKTAKALQEQGNGNLRSILAKYGNAVLKSRQVSKQEAIALATGIPMYQSTRSSIHVPVSLPKDRLRYLKPKKSFRTHCTERSNLYRNLLW